MKTDFSINPKSPMFSYTLLPVVLSRSESVALAYRLEIITFHCCLCSNFNAPSCSTKST